MMTARQLMTETPFTVTPRTKIRKAVETLQRLDIRHLPVVNAAGELVGMISDRDLRTLAVPCFTGYVRPGKGGVLDATVGSMMKRDDLVFVDEQADAAEVIDLMIDNKVGAIPVVDRRSKLVGIISYIDILRVLALQACAAE